LDRADVVEESGQPRKTDTDEPELRIAFLRRADVEILDTWHVGGLRGPEVTTSPRTMSTSPANARCRRRTPAR
jgi:hypothetical protein